MVLDTNVAKVANGQTEQVDQGCIVTCLKELAAIRSHCHLLLDDRGLILQEYLRQKPHGFPQGAGDAFLVWVYDNQANPSHVRSIPVTPLDDDPRGFTEFPHDKELSKFDREDRKFVAVALASGENPPILNATDSDWIIHRVALERNGIHVKCLCPRVIKHRD